MRSIVWIARNGKEEMCGLCLRERTLAVLAGYDDVAAQVPCELTWRNYIKACRTFCASLLVCGLWIEKGCDSWNVSDSVSSQE